MCDDVRVPLLNHTVFHVSFSPNNDILGIVNLSSRKFGINISNECGSEVTAVYQTHVKTVVKPSQILTIWYLQSIVL